MYTYIIIMCSLLKTIMKDSGAVWINIDKHMVYYYIFTIHYTFIHVPVSLTDKYVVPPMTQIQLRTSSRGWGSFQLGGLFPWWGRCRTRCSCNRAAIARRRPARYMLFSSIVLSGQVMCDLHTATPPYIYSCRYDPHEIFRGRHRRRDLRRTCRINRNMVVTW